MSAPRPPAPRLRLAVAANDHAGLAVALLAAGALRARVPGLELRDDAEVVLEATGERLALRGRAVPAASLGLPSLAPDAVARSRRRMALARAGAPVAAGWREATLVAASGAPCALDDGADVLALAEEAATAGCPAVVRAALGQDAPAGDALAPALVELLDEALALALGVAWARAGVHDPGVVALAERRAAEERAAGDRDGAARMVERLRRAEREARAATDDRAAEVEALQRLLRTAQEERDAAREERDAAQATVEALLAEARAAATVPEPEPPRGGLLRRRRG